MTAEEFGRLLETGWTSSQPWWEDGVPREQWARRDAIPWWRALVERAGDDGLTVHCFVGYSPNEHEPLRASARLLHPHTGQTSLYWHDTSTGLPAIEQWRALAAGPPPGPPFRDPVASGDYQRLQQRGMVAALYFSPPAYSDPRYPEPAPSDPVELERWRHGFPRHGSRADRRRMALNMERKEQGQQQELDWQREQLEPWWAQLVALARADGFVLHCEKGVDSDNPAVTSVYGTAAVLVPETGLARYELEQAGDDLRTRHCIRALRDEAIDRD